jgi:hypothetical protein
MSIETLPWEAISTLAPGVEIVGDDTFRPEPHKREPVPGYPEVLQGTRDSDWATEWMSEAVQRPGGSLKSQRLARFPTRLQGSLDSDWAAEWMGGEGSCCGSCADGGECEGGGSKGCGCGSSRGCSCNGGNNEPCCESCAIGGQCSGRSASPATSLAAFELVSPIDFASIGFPVKGCEDECKSNDDCKPCRVCDVGHGSTIGGGPKPPPVHRKLNKALENLGTSADWIALIGGLDSLPKIVECLPKISATLAQSVALSGALAGIGAWVLQDNRKKFGVPVYARLCGQECKTRPCGMLWWAHTQKYCADVDYGWKIIRPKNPHLPGHPWNQTWSPETKWESENVKKLVSGKLAKLVVGCEKKRNPKKTKN